MELLTVVILVGGMIGIGMWSQNVPSRQTPTRLDRRNLDSERYELTNSRVGHPRTLPLHVIRNVR